MMEELMNMITESHKMLSTTVMELTAIWLNKSIVTGDMERRVRICQGVTVRFEGDNLVDCSDRDKATHRVERCFGTTCSNFSMVLTDLESGELVEKNV